MKKIIFILVLLSVLFGCVDFGREYTTAGYVISFDSYDYITFYGLEESWKSNDSFYIPSSIYGRSVTRLARSSSATWKGCDEIYIPSTVSYIASNTFGNHDSGLKKIYWNKKNVTTAAFVPSGVEFYTKNNNDEYYSMSYSFVQSSDGYWISNNNGVDNSTATYTWSVTVGSSATLLIDYDVSSESGYDYFNLSIDNTNVVSNASGTVTNTVTRTLTSGTHTITATYSKNHNNSRGSDRAKVKFVVNGITPTAGMTLVTGGTFSMGHNNGEEDEKPVHSVTLSNFYICDHEVTQAEFSQIMGTNPSNFTSSPASGEVQSNRPVEKVSWYAALAYCNKRSLAEGKTPCYSVSGVTDWAGLSYSSIPISNNTNWNNATCNWSANGYRLPTEAEWEYAARGGTNNSSYTYSGSNTIDNVAWYYLNAGSKTHEVKKKVSNALSLYDMSGNVWEWCWDCKESYSSGAVTNPHGASSEDLRVVRGGSWHYEASDCRVAARSGGVPFGRGNTDGFRVVRNAQ